MSLIFTFQKYFLTSINKEGKKNPTKLYKTVNELFNKKSLSKMKFMKFYQPFKINIEVNKATGNTDKCTQ